MNNLYMRDVLREQFRCILRDSYAGFMSFTHNSLTLVGLAALLAMTLLLTQPELRSNLQKLATLQTREQQDDVAGAGTINQLTETARHYAAQTSALLGLHEAVSDAETSEAALAISEVKSPLLGKPQKNVARYLSTRYHVNPTAVELLVIAAQETGKEIGMEPSELLAVMAVESGFNPFAQSTVGAQGLMQVMSKVHADKLDDFGGSNAALNPVANLQVGALILKDCIRRGGSVQAGLRLYVGVGMGDDGGYGDKVLQEKQRIDQAARGIIIKMTTAVAKAPAATAQPALIEIAPHAESTESSNEPQV